MTTDKLTQYLEQMAAKLGVAAEHVYGVLVRQQVAEGWTYVVLAVGLLLIVLLCGIASWATRNDYENFSANAFITGCGAFLLCLLACGAGVRHIINPEYYAIREIMEVLAR
ncbi:hypothetical protein I532_04200 [Brevibacillus borstelensis AK1]|uniref:Transmembrane protein n=1 Tax=Brevibacillus borstelensis AK1 TaxID=1300222 RepID=M8DMB3_9BACL|nr:hypothetical protein [Brevibacillus borstelensis]EMT54778.1 hypothetical protein I532_04200 [Brevibacillus borstelensis AK1]